MLSGKQKPSLAKLQRWFSQQILRQKNPRNRRLAIYTKAYLLRLEDSLAHDFKRVRRILGKKRFRLLVREYLAAYPSRYFNITDAGKNLPKFLKGHRYSRVFPSLSRLAEMEWLILESFFAEDCAPWNNEIPRTQFSRLRFVLDTSVRLQRKSRLIYRKGGSVKVEKISPSQWELLEQLARGKTLESAIGSIDTLSAPQVNRWFRRWVSQGVFQEIVG